MIEIEELELMRELSEVYEFLVGSATDTESIDRSHANDGKSVLTERNAS